MSRYTCVYECTRMGQVRGTHVSMYGAWLEWCVWAWDTEQVCALVHMCVYAWSTAQVHTCVPT